MNQPIGIASLPRAPHSNTSSYPVTTPIHHANMPALLWQSANQYFHNISELAVGYCFGEKVYVQKKDWQQCRVWMRALDCYQGNTPQEGKISLGE